MKIYKIIVRGREGQDYLKILYEKKKIGKVGEKGALSALPPIIESTLNIFYNANNQFIFY